MATSLVRSWQCSMWVSGFSMGGAPIETGKRTGRSWDLAASSWDLVGPTKALRGQSWRAGQGIRRQRRRPGTLPVLAAVGKDAPDEKDDDDKDDEEEGPSQNNAGSELFRQQMERMIGNDAKDARFEGKDLAQLIRNKYGRSYDVQLIKKEFLGRQLLAMNVMWKYREQRSFPLTEEEYLLHLDYIAQNLRGWGAVSYVRDSLERTRERPRIGKAVSIFINPDESGERSREWINR